MGAIYDLLKEKYPQHKKKIWATLITGYAIWTAAQFIGGSFLYARQERIEKHLPETYETIIRRHIRVNEKQAQEIEDLNQEKKDLEATIAEFETSNSGLKNEITHYQSQNESLTYSLEQNTDNLNQCLAGLDVSENELAVCQITLDNASRIIHQEPITEEPIENLYDGSRINQL